MTKNTELPYNIESLKREGKKYYISASEDEINEMLEFVGKKSLDELYSHIDKSTLMDKKLNLPSPKNYHEIMFVALED